MYPHHVFNLEPAGTFGMYPICYQQVSGRYFQPEPAMYSKCFHWFLGPLTPCVCKRHNIPDTKAATWATRYAGKEAELWKDLSPRDTLDKFKVAVAKCYPNLSSKDRYLNEDLDDLVDEYHY